MTDIYIADISTLDIQTALECVSEYRREKALRINNELKRRQSLGAELLLQKAVGRDCISYCIGENGKPFFPDSDICFSLSHSGVYAVCAVSDREVGVDIEAPRANSLKLAKRFFTQSESEAISSCDVPDKEFCRYWVRKEAYIKAIGKGLACPLNSFDAADRIGDYSAKSIDFGEYCIGICVKAAECDVRLHEVEI